MSEILIEIPDPTDSLRREFSILWAAQKAVGLEGYMSVYTIGGQEPWRSQKENEVFWFSEAETEQAIAHINKFYNDGKLPNTTLLLNPIVHRRTENMDYIPLGSGIFWATALTLGIAKMTEDQKQRIDWLNVTCTHMHRGENEQAGLKMLGFSDKKLDLLEDGVTVAGCRELYELTDIQSDPYWFYYPLSNMNYLSLHGIYNPPHFNQLLKEELREASPEEIVKAYQVDVQKTIDCNTCWNAYDRHHTLYVRFGQDTKDIPHNNRFYNLCARDLFLFDRTGPQRASAEETFEFVVPGFIPRGAVTLLAAAGGTGKSSVAHQLCVLASMDYEEGDEPDRWLGQPLNRDACTGICVYFSGEDGPAITNARGKLFDPYGRAKRLQFHRTEYQDQEISFSEYLRRLHKMPDVSIVVIDPARKYLDGDEDNSECVSDFFEAIEEFAIRKRAAMVVVHHLQKGAKPQSAEEVREELRGSQVFIDRARVVIGMYRNDIHTAVGLAKTNIPPSLGMVMEERIFARNPKNLKLIQLPGEEGTKQKFLSEQELEQMEYEELQRQMEKEMAEEAAKKAEEAKRNAQSQ